LAQLTLAMDSEIADRERERRTKSGFNEVRPRDGAGSLPRDGRNRLGRPTTGAYRQQIREI
jgi:hypothetical protein